MTNNLSSESNSCQLESNFLSSISISYDDFDIGVELAKLQKSFLAEAGAVVSFSGYVRCDVRSDLDAEGDDKGLADETDSTGNEPTDLSKTSGTIASKTVKPQRKQSHSGNSVSALVLEHYPDMCEKQIAKHVTAARKRWPLLGVTIIHRVGTLAVGEQIVLVAVASKHRKAAFAAGEFLMDYLKSEAPIWKKQLSAEGGKWVEAKTKDRDSLRKWE